MEKVVIALGGKSLQPKANHPTAEEQLKVVKKTCGHLADISCKGYEIAIVHGNGPQVGDILLASEEAAEVTPSMPFVVCGAMSQGYIGYHMQQALKYEMNARGRHIPVLTVATQVMVDKNDPAFANPMTPIGASYPREEAEKMQAETGFPMREYGNRGWRRLVASPAPQRIVELEAIKAMWQSKIVISCGGGGIPVIENMDGTLEGVAAVIDKDYAAELLAENLDADILLILTEVENVALHWNTPQQQNLSSLTLKEGAEYIAQGQFQSGTMLPKVEAAMKFVRCYPDKKAIITSLDKAMDALEGKCGTTITFA